MHIKKSRILVQPER